MTKQLRIEYLWGIDEMSLDYKTLGWKPTVSSILEHDNFEFVDPDHETLSTIFRATRAHDNFNETIFLE